MSHLRYFEENRGQADEKTLFLSRDGDWTMLLHDAQIDMVPSQGSPVTLRMAGSSGAVVSGVDRLPGVTHRYFGNDPKRWIVGARHFSSVRYSSVYDGIDMLVHATARGYEYAFDVAPGADASIIRLSFDGRTKLSVDRSGDLVIRSGHNVMRHRAPRAWQGASPVDVGFAVSGSTARFRVGRYDRTLPLVIDPSLEFSSYLGGSGRSGAADFVADMTVDSAGNIYVLGRTGSLDFPMTGGTAVAPANCDQYYCNAKVFVTKFDPTGSTILYSVLFGGIGSETAGGLFVDPSGNAWITGTTVSSNFPTVNPYQATYGGAVFYDGDAFVTKLDSTGAMTWSTYLGGSSGDAGVAIAVDGAGCAYVTGRTASYGFPTTTGAFQTSLSFGGVDGFVTKFAADGQSLAYSTLLGGGYSGNYNGDDKPSGIAVDGSGYAYVVGTTDSLSFPVANAIQPTHAGGPCTTCPSCGCHDGFVTKLNQTGTGLVWSTFLGGSSNDLAWGVTLGPGGAVYVTGETASTNFPLANAYQSTIGASGDAFVTKINAAGNAIEYSTFLGGDGNDRAEKIAVNSAGEIHVAGTTMSTNFPTKSLLHGFKGVPANCYLIYGGDAFVTKFNATGSALVFSTYLGGTGADEAKGIALGAADVVYVAGQTCSSDFPTALPYQASKKGTQGNAFFAKIVRLSTSSTTTAVTSSSNPSAASESVTFTATVTSGTAGTITGTVTFKDGATVIGSATLSSGTASMSTATLSSSSHSITGVYSGDASYDGSTSPVLTQTVNLPPFGPPPGFSATASSASQIVLAWSPVSGAVNYEIFRSSGNSVFGLLTATASTGYTDSGLTTDTTYLYKVRTVGSSSTSAFTPVDASTTVIFTDDPLSIGTAARAAHITELRTAVNAMRAAAGLTPQTFTGSTVAAGTIICAAHVTELRTALDQARAAIGLLVLTYTDPTIIVGSTTVKASHFAELRSGVK